jgi:hypothetical protein
MGGQFIVTIPIRLILHISYIAPMVCPLSSLPVILALKHLDQSLQKLNSFHSQGVYNILAEIKNDVHG